MTPQEFLDRAKAVYLAGCGQYRDSLLEVGRLLHGYLRVKAQEAGELSEWNRRELRLARKDCVRAAAAELGVTPNYVQRLVAATMVVDLLGGGNGLGTLGHGTIYRFSGLIRRQCGTRECPLGGPGGPPIADRETWEVRPKYDGRAQDLFRRAVAEGYSQARCYEEVIRVIGGKKPIPGRPRRVKADETVIAQLRQAASVASPGDVADMCLDLVQRATDPAAVAERLLSQLKVIQRDGARRRQHSFAS